MTGKRLVDRVIDDFENHVVQTRSVIRIADIHARSFTDSVQTFEYLNAG